MIEVERITHTSPDRKHSVVRLKFEIYNMQSAIRNPNCERRW